MARRIWEENMKQRLSASSVEAGSNAGTSMAIKNAKLTKAECIKEIKLDKFLGGTYALQYNFDGSALAAGFSGGGVKLFDPLTGKQMKELRPNRHGGFAVMCLRFHPKEPNLLYVCTSEGNVYLINIDTTDMKQVVTEPGNEINCMDFSMDGYNFATSGKSLDVHVYQTKTHQLQKKYEGCGRSGRKMTAVGMESGNTMRVFDLKYTPHNEQVFITAGWDNHIKIWDSRTSDGIMRQIHGPHVCGDALDMQERYILAGSWCANHALQVYEYGEGVLVQDIPFPHTNGAFLYCAKFCDQNVVLAGGSGTHTVEALEVHGAEPRPNCTVNNLGSISFTKPVQAMDCALGGRRFAAGGGDNFIKLCTLTGS